MLISLAAYRRQGVRIKGRIGLPRSIVVDDDIPVTLILTPKGFQEVDVVSIGFALRLWVFHAPLLYFDNSDIYDGPNFPFTLQSRTRWVLSTRNSLIRGRPARDAYIADHPYTVKVAIRFRLLNPIGSVSWLVNLSNGTVAFPRMPLIDALRLFVFVMVADYDGQLARKVKKIVFGTETAKWCELTSPGKNQE